MPSYTKNGRTRASRASQFMPFAALTGYYELARAQERLTEPRHELTEEEGEALSRAVLRLRRGDMVRVRFYDRDGYRTRVGIVEEVDLARRRLRLSTGKVALDDVWTLGTTAGGGASGRG